jgi:YVTN family beta-propeller protein
MTKIVSLARCVLLLAMISGGALAEEAALRRPVAVAPSADGKWVYVGNRDTGSISVVKLASESVAAEHLIGNRLSDLAFLDGERLVALDERAHELIVLDVTGSRVAVAQRLPISPYPVSLQLLPDGQAAVASLWSRRLTFVRFERVARITEVVDLPFAPRAQALLPGGKQLLVADGFGGKLAIVDVAERRIEDLREIPAHNIRGLGVTPHGEMLLVAHQMLNDLAHSIRNDIHWGLLLSNDLRWLKVESVLAGGQHLYRGGHMHPLGDSGRGGGDPGALDVAADGTVIVAISGVNQVTLGKEGDFAMERINVGRRPTAVKFSADGSKALVACTFDDSIAVVDVASRSVAATIPLGRQPELTLAQRGELLFYDARLSHDGWMSCQSCHTDGHTNGQMNDNFSDRSFGAAKRVLSLLGVKDTLPLGWTGQVQSFSRQIHNSVENTMQREQTLETERVDAIAAYLKTLELPPPLDELRGTRDPAAIERGRLVFEQHDCASCHVPPTYTSAAAYDVGLTDSQGLKQYNPPSLRGLSHRSPFFHDNRATTLQDVFLKHGHPSEASYSSGEIDDLVAFLMSL